ncbi:hypothetical protein BJX70DRAFT_397610 [Aspergillus crustosus]
MPGPRGIKRKAEAIETWRHTVPAAQAGHNALVPTHIHPTSQATTRQVFQRLGDRIALSPDGRFFAVGCNPVLIMSSLNFRTVEKICTRAGCIYQILFVPMTPGQKGYTLVISTTDGNIWIGHLDHTGRQLGPDGKQRISLEGLSTDLHRHITQHVSSYLVDSHEWSADAAALQRFSRQVKSTLSNACFWLMDAHMASLGTIIPGCFVKPSPDGTFLLCATITPRAVNDVPGVPLLIWDLKKMETRHILPCPLPTVKWATVSPDSNLVAVGEKDKIVRIWDAHTATSKDVIGWRKGLIWRTGVFSPDSRFLALTEYISAKGSKVCIYELATKEFLNCFHIATRHELPPVVWHPSGTHLAIGGATGVYLWDHISNAVCMDWILPAHLQEQYKPVFVHSLEFLSNGEKLVMTTTDGVTMVYNSLSGNLHSFPRDNKNSRMVLYAKGAECFVMLDLKVVRIWSLDHVGIGGFC